MWLTITYKYFLIFLVYHHISDICRRLLEMKWEEWRKGCDSQTTIQNLWLQVLHLRASLNQTEINPQEGLVRKCHNIFSYRMSKTTHLIPIFRPHLPVPIHIQLSIQKKICLLLFNNLKELRKTHMKNVYHKISWGKSRGFEHIFLYSEKVNTIVCKQKSD